MDTEWCIVLLMPLVLGAITVVFSIGVSNTVTNEK